MSFEIDQIGRRRDLRKHPEGRAEIGENLRSRSGTGAFFAGSVGMRGFLLLIVAVSVAAGGALRMAIPGVGMVFFRSGATAILVLVSVRADAERRV